MTDVLKSPTNSLIHRIYAYVTGYFVRPYKSCLFGFFSSSCYSTKTSDNDSKSSISFLPIDIECNPHFMTFLCVKIIYHLCLNISPKCLIHLFANNFVCQMFASRPIAIVDSFLLFFCRMKFEHVIYSSRYCI